MSRAKAPGAATLHLTIWKVATEALEVKSTEGRAAAAAAAVMPSINLEGWWHLSHRCP